ncbi:MAG: InlB B-repeat-containing protein [Lachnospiraceae bacterium]|nr:InlB B-repeat-containing protein [Lachnospiraceae bacterium]
MEDNKTVITDDTQAEDKKQREFRGLYKNVKISVKTLDFIIVICIVVIVVLVALDLRNPGFTITFDSKGGTDVVPQNQMYGEMLEVPQPPTREGYVFTGWYLDHVCEELWEEDVDVIECDITLYAGWKEDDCAVDSGRVDTAK